jgi:hypothetical protein
MPNGVQTLQVANPAQSTVSRMPQTTAQPTTPAGAAPFTRLSRQGQILGPAQSANAYGSLWTPTLKPVGGYLRYLEMKIFTAGQSGSTTDALAQDCPYNVIQNLFLRDPYGQPIIQADGFSLALINFYGGQRGMLGFNNDPGSRPSFTAPTTASGSASVTPDGSPANGNGGNFDFTIEVPLEMDSSGYCSLASMNAASQPQMQLQFNPSATLYTTAPSTLGTITAVINEPFWMAPVDNPQIAPPDVGSSGQWSVTRAQSIVASSAFQRIVLPRVGTFIHTLITILRDTGTSPVNQRVEAYPPTDLSLWVDGVPILYEYLDDRRDRMYQEFGAYSFNPFNGPAGKAPTGVVAYSFRESVQTAVSTADTYDLLLPTTPATLLEQAGTYQTFTGSGLLFVVTGELFPVSGIPYTHLAQ